MGIPKFFNWLIEKYPETKANCIEDKSYTGN